MRQGTIIKTASTGCLLSLADAKMQLQMDPGNTDMDAHITQLCSAAHSSIEDDLGYPLLQQTRETHLDAFPCGPIWLGGGASAEIIQIRYFDQSGVQQTLSSGDYILDLVSRPATVVPAPLKSWPFAQSRPGAVIVEWRAGWTAPDQAPAALVHAMKLLVSAWEHDRENGESDQVKAVINELLRPYRLKFVA